MPNNSIISCMKHPTTIIPRDGEKTVYEPSGNVALLDEKKGVDNNGTTTVAYGRVTGLPAPRPGVKYLVPLVVGIALRNERSDLLVPYDQVRDANNSVIIGFARELVRPV